MGVDRAQSAIDDVLFYTAERLRRRVAALPVGKHSFTTWLDDDGSGGAPVPIVATVTLGGETLHVDGSVKNLGQPACLSRADWPG